MQYTVQYTIQYTAVGLRLTQSRSSRSEARAAPLAPDGATVRVDLTNALNEIKLINRATMLRRLAGK